MPTGAPDSPAPLLTDKDAAALSFVGALAGHIARYTVAIIPEKGDDAFGTGVLVSSAGAFYIATAKHIAETLRDTVTLIPRFAAPLKIVRRGEQSFLPAETRTVRVVRRLMSSTVDNPEEPEEDVALLGLPDRPDALRWMNFFPLERASSAPASHPGAVVYRYGWDVHRVDPPRKAQVGFRIVLGRLGTKGPRQYSPDPHLLVHFDDEGGKGLKGISGGGVWIPPSLGRGLVNPDEVTLGGIQCARFKRYAGKPLLATRIERLAALLSIR